MPLRHHLIMKRHNIISFRLIPGHIFINSFKNDYPAFESKIATVRFLEKRRAMPSIILVTQFKRNYKKKKENRSVYVISRVEPDQV